MGGISHIPRRVPGSEGPAVGLSMLLVSVLLLTQPSRISGWQRSYAGAKEVRGMFDALEATVSGEEEVTPTVVPPPEQVCISWSSDQGHILPCFDFYLSANMHNAKLIHTAVSCAEYALYHEFQV